MLSAPFVFSRSGSRGNVGAVIGKLSLLAGPWVAALCLTGCERELPISAADKEVVLRAADLTAYGFGLEKTERYETFKRIRYFDGSHELTYEFQTPDSGQDDALYINVVISVERSRADALTTYGAQKVGLTVGLKSNDVEQREVENFYSYGDSSTFAILEKDGHPIGNIFTARDGRRVFMLMLSGMYFEDAATFRELIESRLEKFSAYEPT
jgi:hypothetical protein